VVSSRRRSKQGHGAPQPLAHGCVGGAAARRQQTAVCRQRWAAQPGSLHACCSLHPLYGAACASGASCRPAAAAAEWLQYVGRGGGRRHGAASCPTPVLTDSQRRSPPFHPGTWWAPSPWGQREGGGGSAGFGADRMWVRAVACAGRRSPRLPRPSPCSIAAVYAPGAPATHRVSTRSSAASVAHARQPAARAASSRRAPLGPMALRAAATTDQALGPGRFPLVPLALHSMVVESLEVTTLVC
jgi:hypothetical protein